ncbi:LuxR family transcriptional regulator [Nocardia abscessus]|uniref:LuxR C-terminal-related transcriptional regulator n=1 Tax=Nocardia abscessus TaxID=120957 RepID=UPI001894DB32|nr:LuxR C-terminal-related transcriptional regulator [Nocardia abscessus]MBF6340894.1 LuxR family transcriptional regulator [Nocardia abscessus]
MVTSDIDAVPPDRRTSSDTEPVEFRVPRDGQLFLDAVTHMASPPTPCSDLADTTVTLAGAQASPTASTCDPVDAPARLQADRELLELLIAHAARGLVWEKVVEDLSAYAAQVLDSWIRSGMVFTQLARKLIGVNSWPAGRERLASDKYYREDVVAHCIVRALDKLQHKLRTGQGWDPRKGSSLATYFITGCLNEFVYVFEKERQWWTTTHQPGNLDARETSELLDAGARVLWSSAQTHTDIAEMVTDRIFVLEHLATLTDTERTILWAVADGYTHAEIAHLLHVTTKAVERRLSRMRTRARMSVRNRG